MEYQRLIHGIERADLFAIYEFVLGGGNLNGYLYRGMTPLIYAIDCCRKIPVLDLAYDEIIPCLIDWGAKVNVRHPHNNLTALMLALENRRSETVIRRLICAKADVTARCALGKTPLIYAIQNYYNKGMIIEILYAGSNLNQPPEGFTPLYCALSCKRSFEIIELMVSRGADVNVINWRGQNLLNLIPCQGRCRIDGLCEYKPITDILINGGIDIKRRDNDGNTIIHTVNCNYLIHLALKSGVSIETKNHNHKTPLAQALIYYEQKKVNDLLLLKADPNCVDNFQCTPLHYSRVMNSKNLSNILLYHGANLLAENVFNNTPLKVIFMDFDRHTVNDIPEGVKVMVQYYLLFINENDLDELINKSTFNWKDILISYLKRCRNELHNMRNIFITEGLSFYKFCHLNKLYREKCIYISIDKYKYDYMQIRNFFPIYHGLIIMRIRRNGRTKFREDMIKNLGRISIRPQPSKDSSCTIQLLDHCPNIGRYLTNEQLYNLFLASL